MPSPKAWHKCAEARLTCLGCVHSLTENTFLLSPKMYLNDFGQKVTLASITYSGQLTLENFTRIWEKFQWKEIEWASLEPKGMRHHESCLRVLAEARRCAILVASLLSLLARICQDREDYWATYSAFDWEFCLHQVTSASKFSDTSLFPHGIRCCLAVVPVQLLLFTCAEYRATIRVRVIHLKWAAPRAFFFQSVPYAMITPGLIRKAPPLMEQKLQSLQQAQQAPSILTYFQVFFTWFHMS